MEKHETADEKGAVAMGAGGDGSRFLLARVAQVSESRAIMGLGDCLSIIVVLDDDTTTQAGVCERARAVQGSIRAGAGSGPLQVEWIEGR